MECPGLAVKIILNLILNKQCRRLWTEFIFFSVREKWLAVVNMVMNFRNS